LKSLDDAVKMAEDIDAELAKLDAKPEAHERKMVFDTTPVGGNVTRNSSSDVNSRFIRKHTLDDYGVEELALTRMILNARGSEMPDEYERKFQSLADRIVKYTMTTGGAGTGAELIDTVMWNRLFQDVTSKTLVAGLFSPWRDMVTQSEEMPSLADVTFYKPAGEGQTVTATDLTTAKRTLTAYTLKAQVDISDEEDDDAIVGMIPEIRAILIRNAKEVIDEAILNADASTGKQNINYYAATGGSDIPTSHRLLLGFDGLIHYCLNEVTGQATDLSALTVDDFAALISLLGKYADDPSRCAFIIDRYVKNKAILLDDFLTTDKMGAQATLLTGQIGQVFGVPVVLSGQLVKANATGQVDQTPGSNTTGRIILVNRDMWQFGIRRNIRVAVQRDEAKTMTSIVASMRIALQCFGDRSSAAYSHTALGFNVTV
jgi:HK97 family phage major capsid protein